MRTPATAALAAFCASLLAPAVTLAGPAAPAGSLSYTATHDLAAELVSPKPGDAAGDVSATFDVKTSLGGGVELAVDGATIPAQRIGKRTVDTKTGETHYFFYGVALVAGPNTVTLVPLGSGGLRGTPVNATVYGPGPANVMTASLDHPLIADGKTGGKLVLAFRDRWGHAVAPHGKAHVSIVSGPAHFGPQADSATAIAATTVAASIVRDTTAAGAADSDRSVDLTAGGYAVLPLVPTQNSGEVLMRVVTDSGYSDSCAFFVKPDVRKPIVVGIVTGGVGAVPGLPGTAADAADAADSRRARAAFYLKGSVGGSTLLTMAYETANSLDDRLSAYGTFVQNPLDRPYQTYGDEAMRSADALSQNHLYVRADQGRTSVMYGEFDANTADPQSQSVGAFHEFVNGVNITTGTAATTVSAFAAKNQFGFGRLALDPTGLSVLEQTLHAPVVPGTEQVLLVSRDRHSGAIVTQTELVANVDYAIDDQTGLLRFINVPLPFDSFLNPQTVVITYQYTGADVNAQTSGGRVQTAVSRNVTVGAGYVNDSTGTSNFTLLNQDLYARLTGGTLAISHATSNGVAGNVDAVGDLGSAATSGSGGALQVTYDQKFGPMHYAFSYGSTSAGFADPFGGLASPGLNQYTASLGRQFGPGGELQFDAENEHLNYGGVTASGARFGAKLRKVLAKGVTVTFGLQRVSQSGVEGSYLDSIAQATGMLTSMQYESGLTWKASSKVTVGIDRTGNLGGGQTSTLYPTETDADVSYATPNGKAFLRQRWSDVPNASLFSAPVSTQAAGGSNLSTVSGSSNSTEIGFDRSLGKATDVTSELLVGSQPDGEREAYWGEGVNEKFAFGKGLSGSFNSQFVGPIGASTPGAGSSTAAGTPLGGYAVYDLNTAYTNADHFRFASDIQQRTGIGSGNSILLGTAGPLGGGWNVLGTIAAAHFAGTSTSDGRVGFAWRPEASDRGASLVEYEEHSGNLDVSDAVRSNLLAMQEVYRPSDSLELGGRVAYKLDGDGFYAAHTSLFGVRVLQRVVPRLDIGSEFEAIALPGNAAARTTTYAAELGYRLNTTTRIAAGYSFDGSIDPTLTGAPTHRGVYATITSLVDRLLTWGQR
jgi:hypothetical protein